MVKCLVYNEGDTVLVMFRFCLQVKIRTIKRKVLLMLAFSSFCCQAFGEVGLKSD